MRFTSSTQLKDWIKNKSKQTGVPANILPHEKVLQIYGQATSINYPYAKGIALPDVLALITWVFED